MRQFSGYAQFYDKMNSLKPYEKELAFVYNWMEEPKTMLDLGCGTAQYWKHLPILPTGIERSIELADASDYKESIITADILKLPLFPNLFDGALALFDVVNYTPHLNWIERLPIKRGGYFVFDIWDKEKVDRDGFTMTQRKVGKLKRTILPDRISDKIVQLHIKITAPGQQLREVHVMHLHSRKDIERACGGAFEIAGIIPTNKWQKWYRLRRK